jgi:hypothetical protein
MQPKAIYTLKQENKEAHMVGSCVGVCWNIRHRNETRTIIGADGLIYTATAELWERYGNPYIDFLTVLQDKDGEYYENDNNPVEGGVSIDFARLIASELNSAIAYLHFITESEL